MKKIYALFLFCFLVNVELFSQCVNPTIDINFSTSNNFEVTVTNSYPPGVQFEYTYRVNGAVINNLNSFSYLSTFNLVASVGTHEVEVKAICGISTSVTTIEALEIATVADITAFNASLNDPYEYLDGLKRICDMDNILEINNTDLEVLYEKVCFCESYDYYLNDFEIENIDIAFNLDGEFWVFLEEQGCLIKNDRKKQVPPITLQEPIIKDNKINMNFDEISKVIIYDINGKLFYSYEDKDFESNQLSIPEAIDNGLFFMHFITKDNYTEVRKVLIR